MPLTSARTRLFLCESVNPNIYLGVVISANVTRVTQTRKTGKGLSFVGPRLNMKTPDVVLLMTTAPLWHTTAVNRVQAAANYKNGDQSRAQLVSVTTV